MSDKLNFVVAMLTALTLICGLIGLGIRFVLMPYLKEHLIAPMQQVRKQVTENHHSNPEPTVLDRIDDVHKEVMALARMFDGHLEWSQNEVDLIWEQVDPKKKHRRRRRPSP